MTIASFFSASVADSDPELASSLRRELARQQDQVELIASENIVSAAVLEAQGSVLTNKYAEGYPGRRYYGGCEYRRYRREQLAIDRAKALFGCSFANVQPHSGAQANQAVFMALLQPGDTILGMSLAAGGHLTHGASLNQSGKWFNAIQYGVRREDALIDYDQVARSGARAQAEADRRRRLRLPARHRLRPLPRDRRRGRGLPHGRHGPLRRPVAGGVYPNPVPHAHVVTTTTHKTLRGPRGGMVLSNDEALGKKINSAVFPGLQGGPLMHVIAAKAVAFGEALRPEFKTYAQDVVDNARALATRLVDGGVDIVSGGTDSHLVLVDLRPKGLTGKAAEASLERAGMTCNKNGIPFDPEKPMVTSGVRLGTPAATTRGFGVAEFTLVGELISEVLDGLAATNSGDNAAVEAKVRGRIHELCGRFPIYGGQSLAAAAE